jgi:hypothetical protein
LHDGFETVRAFWMMWPGVVFEIVRMIYQIDIHRVLLANRGERGKRGASIACVMRLDNVARLTQVDYICEQ